MTGVQTCALPICFPVTIEPLVQCPFVEKDGKVGKDDLARAEKELEKVTSDHVTKIDELLKHKESELLEV